MGQPQRLAASQPPLHEGYVQSRDLASFCRNYLKMNVIFFIVSVINNYAFYFHVPMTLHMIFRAVSSTQQQHREACLTCPAVGRFELASCRGGCAVGYPQFDRLVLHGRAWPIVPGTWTYQALLCPSPSTGFFGSQHVIGSDNPQEKVCGSTP